MPAVVDSSESALMHHAVVTGASGFIGRQLCRNLRDRGVEVTALHRHSQTGPWNREMLIDLGVDTKFSFSGNVDSVFHLAGFAHAQHDSGADALHQAVTVEGTARLLDACGPAVRRFVYFSSVKAMGESTTTSCVDETFVPRPSTTYGRARLLAEQRILEQTPRMHTSILRLPLVYGPGVKGNLQRLLKAVQKRHLPLLPDFTNRRSMVHVEDVAHAALAAAAQPCAAGQVYLLCDGQRYSTRAIQLCMYQAVGVEHPLLRIPRFALYGVASLGDALHALGIGRFPIDSAVLAKLSASACYDATRARTELGWRPQHRLADALPAMLAALTPCSNQPC